ncbi:MAG TPA: SIR2 family protein [Solirubrobacteraceae bacterium]|jgi:tetratricopeptide (TPR) repeat protein|nr:SIR2 family protein [Solirubrobacteraceae bacterium]
MSPDRLPNVFSGAGLSIPPPASLSGGPWLRDVVLKLCASAADDIAPGTGRTALRRGDGGPQIGADWKLEFVLGRLVETAGPSALDVLRCLRVEVPNEAHMLAAWCLAHGALHATVNFDRGVERAYALLRGSPLAAEVPGEYRDALAEWRTTLAGETPPLTVVVGDRSEADWLRRPQPGTLFKLHGSLKAADHAPLGVVVSDFVEYLPVTPERRRILRELCDGPLVVTGYSGGDADLHAPLLGTLDPARTIWSDPGAGAAMREASERGIETAPLTAVSVLRRWSPLEELPSWPISPTGLEPDLEAETARWANGVDPIAAAHAWAWMLIDTGRHDTAIELCERLVEVSPSLDVRRRLADAYFMRGTVGDKRRALPHYRRIVRPGATPPGLRAYAVLRLGACHRTLAFADGRVHYGHVTASVVYALTSLAWNRAEGNSAAVRGEALASFGHLALRLAEWRMARGRGFPRSLLRPALRLGLCAQGAARRAGGHALRFARLQHTEMRCLLWLLEGSGGAPERSSAAIAELRALERDYRNLNNPIGAANARAAQALAELVRGDAAEARARLGEAKRLYRAAGAERGSGGRLLGLRRGLVERWAGDGGPA